MRREFHGQAHRRNACALPCLPLCANGGKHPFANGDNHSRALGHRDKLGWKYQSQFMMLPAQQRFHANDASRIDVYPGLVVNEKFFTLYCLAQFVFHYHPSGNFHRKHFGIMFIVVSSSVFCVIHSDIGIFQEGIDIIAVSRIQGNSYTGGNHQFVAVYNKRM